MNRIKRTVSIPFLVISYLLTSAVWFHANIASVYALPEPVTGWVEVRCDTVPDDFSQSATAVFSNTETGETYTITCQKINDYLARLKVPAGKYQVDHVSTADNFRYEAFTDVASFEITAGMPAAQLIPLKIIAHEASLDVSAPEEEDTPSAENTDISADTESPDAVMQPEADQTPSSPSQEEQNAVLDLIDQMAQPDNADGQTSENEAAASTPSALSGLSRVFLVLFGSGLFAAFIFVCAWFLRKHLEDQ